MNIQPPTLPLLSVVVLTYNSSAYVLSTLESIYRQTYSGPIELIIADDCSQDDTVSLCKEWLEKREARFCRAEIIANRENLGVSANCNRACRAARGEWIKGIAGDDILCDNCLEALWKAVSDIGETCTFLATPVYKFESEGQLAHPENLPVMNPIGDASVVDLEFAYDNPMFVIPAPGVFLSRAMLVNIDYHPEIFRNVEDFPMYRKILSHGYVLYMLGTPMVFYRYSASSITSDYCARTGLKPWEVQVVSCDRYLRPAMGRFRSLCLYWRMLPLRVALACATRQRWLEKLYIYMEAWRKGLRWHLKQWRARFLKAES